MLVDLCGDGSRERENAKRETEATNASDREPRSVCGKEVEGLMKMKKKQNDNMKKEKEKKEEREKYDTD